MRLQRVDHSLLLTRPGYLDYLLTGLRILHALIAILPGLLLARLHAEQSGLGANQDALLLFFGLLTALLFQAFGIYSDALFSNRLRFRALFFAWSAAFAFLLFMHLGLSLLRPIPVWQLALWFTFSLLGFACERLLCLALFRHLMRRGRFLQNTIILGGTENGLRLAEYLGLHRDIRSGLLGFIDDRLERMPPTLADLPLLGNIEDMERLILEKKITQVLVALPWTAQSRIVRVLDRLHRLPVTVLLMPDMLAFRHVHNSFSEVAGLALFNASPIPPRGWSPVTKRLEDLLLASLALLLLLPLMLLLALALKLEAPGSVLLRQKRFDYNGQPFDLYQFRTLGRSSIETRTPSLTAPITPIGRFIRKTRLDQLPQLFNVLLGNMSLVGPRPLAAASKTVGALLEGTLDHYSVHHAIKPGITGWAQFNGHGGETDSRVKTAQRIELDLEYIEGWSLWLDLTILLRSIAAILRPKDGCRGAPP